MVLCVIFILFDTNASIAANASFIDKQTILHCHFNRVLNAYSFGLENLKSGC